MINLMKGMKMLKIKFKKISKLKALEKIQKTTANAGIFSVRFEKTNGEHRTMVCKRTNANPNVEKDSSCYITVIDLITSEPRTINLDTIDTLIIKDTVFRVS